MSSVCKSFFIYQKLLCESQISNLELNRFRNAILAVAHIYNLIEMKLNNVSYFTQTYMFLQCWAIFDITIYNKILTILWEIVSCWITACIHYSDVINGAIASQITSLTIVYLTVYSDADQRKHQSSAWLVFVWGIHQGPVNSPHKWPVTRRMFPFDDVIMSPFDAWIIWNGKWCLLSLPKAIYKRLDLIDPRMVGHKHGTQNRRNLTP